MFGITVLRNLFSRTLSEGEGIDSNLPVAEPPKDAVSRYSSDQPIKSQEEDRFNRWPFAKRIADTLAARNDPRSLVVALYGPWGDGKTSTLRLMQAALRDHPNIITIEFNPWLFRSDEQLMRGFFATIATALDRSLPTRTEKIGRILEQYGSLLSFSFGSVMQLGVAEAAKGLGKALSAVELEDLRVRIEKFLSEAGKRVVVLIDDVDRLDRAEIHSIFKLVKLSASFEHTSYVLAFDDTVVAAALSESYGQGSETAGRGFLEKIVQVPLHLPPPDKVTLRKMIFEGAEEALNLNQIVISREQASQFTSRFVMGVEPALHTPRQVNLYANALVFSLPLLKGEVNLVDQMLIEAVRVFYPNLFVSIRDNPKFFLEGRRDSRDNAAKEAIAKSISDALNADGVEKPDDVRLNLLYYLFPRLEGVFGRTHYGTEWNTRWARDQRICSEQYFRRFFTYAIPVDDVADAEILKLVASSNDEPQIFAMLEKFEHRGVVRVVIEKLRRMEGDISVTVIPPLTSAIAHHANLLPRENQPLAGQWTISQAGILVANLIKRLVPSELRERLAKQLVQTAEPLTFAVECLRWIRLPKDGAEGARIVSKAVEDEMRGLLVTRIKAQAERNPLYKEFPSEAPHLLWIWHEDGSPEEVSGYLRRRFEANADDVYEFLATYLGTSWGSDGVGRPGDLVRESYNGITELVDPALILSKLQERFGAELHDPQLHGLEDWPLHRRIAHQFAFLHNVAEREKSAQVGAAAPRPAAATGQEEPVGPAS